MHPHIARFKLDSDPYQARASPRLENVCGHVAVCLSFAFKNRRTSSSMRIGSGPASSISAFNGVSTATSANAAATSATGAGQLRPRGRFHK
jgi:hypothetical protein